ncbi:MAG: DNA-binding response regulator [Verrucomicrobiaceae bacterium TMED86]|nr:MAG: DNA-binding response regulator [Verrucomicrobiaceae bacterium TMED86]
MKVLVVEDDAKLSGFIQKGLEAEGFVVDLCSDGDEGYSLATTREYDAMVLDIMLPGRDGLSILRNLREKRIETPVIVLTARGSLNERLDGLKLGADDYMMKPFFVEELAARLHVVARRASGDSRSILSVGAVSLNLLSREAKVGETLIELSPREFALLSYFMRSPGRVFSRAQICEHVWNYHFDPGTNVVDVYIQKLRKKLGGDLSAQIIETVRGVGYRARKDEQR